MRCWDDEGTGKRRRWGEAEHLLTYGDVLVLNEENASGDGPVVARFASPLRCAMLMQGSAGSAIDARSDARQVLVYDTVEIDRGAPDAVFPAALFCTLHRGYHAWTLAHFINCIAARFVNRSALSGTPGREQVAHCRRAALRPERNDAHDLRAG
jgi:hypothetical protein